MATTYSRPGVFIQEVELPQTIDLSDNTNAIGAFVGALAKGPTNVPVLVSSWQQFVKIYGGLQDAYPTTWAAYNFFANGGHDLYIQRVVGSGAAAASVMLTDASASHINTILVQAASKGSWGNSLAVSVNTAGASNRFGLSVYGSPTIAGNATSNLLETYTDLSMDKTDPRYFLSVINAQSSFIGVFDQNSASAAPTNMPVIGATLYALGSTAAGADGSTPTRTNYNTALTSFDPVQNPLVMYNADAPYIYNTSTGSGTDRTNSIGVLNDLVTYCQARGDGFAVLDTPQGLTAAEAQTYANDVDTAFAASSDGGVCAIYYPWLLVPDTLKATPGVTRLQAPGASVVGQYLATDAARGVFKTPAGLTNRVNLAVATDHQFTNAELDSLNTSSNPVNVIRQVPGAGICIMGGRTLKNTAGGRYINVRRSLTYIEKEVKDLTSFAIFENNDANLWNRIGVAIGTFLGTYWQQGGLRGNKPTDAYYVRCDSSNNSMADIMSGKVNIEIGVALEYPAEFVIIKIGQLTGNATA
jgi:phage tail sheath protein FI